MTANNVKNHFSIISTNKAHSVLCDNFCLNQKKKQVKIKMSKSNFIVNLVIKQYVGIVYCNFI